MKRIKRMLAFMLAGILCLSVITVQAEEEPLTHDAVMEAYRQGRQMESRFVEQRKAVAEKLGITEHLDEKAFLTSEYRFANGIGAEGAIQDEMLDILVDVATVEEEQTILKRSAVQFSGSGFFQARVMTNGQTVGATQRKRVSGAGNGYFTVDGAVSYGYCCQNSKSFWSNDGTKSGTISLWDNAMARKILYYAPGGPGYSGGSLGYDMDSATFAIGKCNGDTQNNGRADKLMNSLAGLPDPGAKGYRAYKIDISEPYQDVAFLDYVPPAPPKGRLSLKKTSANPELTNGNSCYSLAGAEYGVYSSSSLSGASRVGTLTTDADGNSNELTLAPGTYYVYELKAPKGYALDKTKHAVTVVSGELRTLPVKDLPQLDPVGILLGKIDAETNANRPQGSASLQGAHFTVKYYAGLWAKGTDPAALGQKAKRSWVFRTNQNGFCHYRKEDLVSGDALYFNSSGVASLPVGTITIQETKAPEGYLLNPEVYVRQITTQGVSENITTYNQPVIPEQLLKLELKKVQAGTDLAIPGAVFEHTKPDGTKEQLTTDGNGMLTVKGLNYGVHRIEEISVMDGYVVNGNAVVFEVASDNSIRMLSHVNEALGNIVFQVTPEGNVSLTVEDPLAPFTLAVHKKNNKGQLLEGAVFTLYSDKECGKEVTHAVTDVNGQLRMTGLETGKMYYLRETEAPKGYRLPLAASGEPVTYEIRTESTPVKDEFFFYVNGQQFSPSSDPNGMFTVEGTKADRETHMTIVNTIGMKLPATGSSMMLLAVMGAVMMLLAALLCRKERFQR